MHFEVGRESARRLGKHPDAALQQDPFDHPFPDQLGRTTVMSGGHPAEKLDRLRVEAHGEGRRERARRASDIGFFRLVWREAFEARLVPEAGLLFAVLELRDVLAHGHLLLNRRFSPSVMSLAVTT